MLSTWQEVIVIAVVGVAMLWISFRETKDLEE